MRMELVARALVGAQDRPPAEHPQEGCSITWSVGVAEPRRGGPSSGSNWAQVRVHLWCGEGEPASWGAPRGAARVRWDPALGPQNMGNRTRRTRCARALRTPVEEGAGLSSQP